MSETKTGEDREQPYAWVMVITAFLLIALSFGGLGAVGVFLKPLASTFGWGRGETAFGYTAISIAAALCGPVWGIVADKYGSRPQLFVAVVAMAVAMALLSRVQSLWQFYGAYFLFGGFGFAALSGPLLANVGFWFKKRPGLAIGLTAAGGALGQAVLPFVARLLISAFDWQTAYLFFAGVYLVCGLPLCFLIRESPTRRAAIKGAGGAAQGLQKFTLPPARAIAWISLAVVFCCFCMAVPIVHIVALASDRGMDPETAAGVLFTLMAAGIVGRILGGRLCDGIGALPCYLLASICQTLLVVLLPHMGSVLGLYLLAGFFGVAYSGVMAAFIICIRMMVPPGFSARGMGIVSSFGMLGMGLGSYAGGLLFDLTGNYILSFAAAGVAGVVNIFILLLFFSISDTSAGNYRWQAPRPEAQGYPPRVKIKDDNGRFYRRKQVDWFFSSLHRTSGLVR